MQSTLRLLYNPHTVLPRTFPRTKAFFHFIHADIKRKLSSESSCIIQSLGCPWQFVC